MRRNRISSASGDASRRLIYAGLVDPFNLDLSENYDDIFDDLNFRRMRAKHWAILDRLRLLGDEREIVWICGNHDGSPEALKRLLGVSVHREFTFT